jgi:hypothetical protein
MVHLNTVDERPARREDRVVYEHEQPRNLMTPARRAALDALEREFVDLLHAAPP